MCRATYIARFNKDVDPGVSRKFNEVCDELNRSGYEVEKFILSPSSPPLEVIKATINRIQFSQSNLIIIRSLGILDLFLWYAVLKRRLRGVYVIIDLPVPRRVLFNEIIPYRKGLKKLLFYFSYLLSGPWVYWPFSRIVQYADESSYFKVGNRRRSILIGNGISPRRLDIRNNNFKWPSSELKLITASTLTSYQGLDRMINAIYDFNRTESSYKVYFTIVGDGPVKKDLMDLVDKLGISEFIIFMGMLKTEEIQGLYSTHHIGVGALGLFRKDIEISSILKLREYCIVGLPFIFCGTDPDFTEKLPFVWNVKNENEVASILQALERFPKQLNKFSIQQIRQYGIANLSHRSKLETLGIPFPKLVN